MGGAEAKKMSEKRKDIGCGGTCIPMIEKNVISPNGEQGAGNVPSRGMRGVHLWGYSLAGGGGRCGGVVVRHVVCIWLWCREHGVCFSDSFKPT